MAVDDDKPSYLRAAFLNVYNLSLLGGALAMSAATGEYVLGAIAAGQPLPSLTRLGRKIPFLPETMRLDVLPEKSF